MKYLISVLFFFLVAYTVFAQNYKSGDVTLVSKTDNTIVLRAVGCHKKKQMTEEEAQKTAFRVLFNIGLEGYNNGKPLVDANSRKENKEYFDKMFSEARYNMFVKTSRILAGPEREGKLFKSTVSIEIYIASLERDMKTYNISPSFGQATSELADQIQLPTIMVVPYRPEGKSFKDVLKNDFDRRIAVAKVQESFNKKGVNTIDFEAKLNAAIRSANFEMNDAQTIDKQLLRNSGSDIYVTVDLKKDFTTAGNRIALILKAYETSTGNVLANKQNWSGRFRTSAIDQLSVMAIRSVMDDFLNQVSTNFQKKADRGNSIVLNISIASDSMTDMDTELGKDMIPLSDLLRIWVKKNAFKGRYHVQGSVAEGVIFDQIQVPPKDENGNLFSVSDFAFNLWDYLRSDMGIACKKRVDGNTVYITIQE
ncbi:DUF6175 family protein [Marinifilum sp.]|uniref:DUF6175 family protein n=1 Tax=Marinifilum sp. TaxID=2033137 RepID=UPI003BA9F6AE